MQIVFGIKLWRPSNLSTYLRKTIDRIPRQHVGWQSITYKGRRYRLGGGIRTDYFINLDNPIGK